MAGKKWSEQTKESFTKKKGEKSELIVKQYLEIASKFEDANMFRKQHNNIHTYLRQRGLLDVAFPNRKRYKPKGYWNLENITKEAKNYTSKKEFFDKCQVAFNKSLKYKGLIDELFLRKNNQ